MGIYTYILLGKVVEDPQNGTSTIPFHIIGTLQFIKNIKLYHAALNK